VRTPYSSLNNAPLRPRRSRGSSALWVAGCLLAVLGVLLAILDVAGGRGAQAAADGAFGGPPVVNQEPDLVATPGQQSPIPAPTVEPEAVLKRAKGKTASQREADVLIEQLLIKLRAERKAREVARTAQRDAKRSAGRR
jgi:hypothetical protein